MNKAIPQPAYNISQEVYHITPESPKGFVINAKYELLTGLWEYEVAFGIGEALIYREHELQLSKTF